MYGSKDWIRVPCAPTPASLGSDGDLGGPYRKTCFRHIDEERNTCFRHTDKYQTHVSGAPENNETHVLGTPNNTEKEPLVAELVVRQPTHMSTSNKMEERHSRKPARHQRSGCDRARVAVCLAGEWRVFKHAQDSCKLSQAPSPSIDPSIHSSSINGWAMDG